MITEKQFDLFKIKCHKYAIDFGLLGYELVFKFKRLSDCYAMSSVDESGKIAVLTLSSSSKSDICIEDVAKHEMLHVLLHRLRWIGESDFNELSLLEEEEKLVRVLEKIV